MTHINAFIAAVSEAETKVAQAQVELEKAKNLLRDKQVELGLLELEPESTPVAEEPASVDEESEPAVEDSEDVPAEPESENSEPDETLAEPEDNKA